MHGNILSIPVTHEGNKVIRHESPPWIHANSADGMEDFV